MIARVVIGANFGDEGKGLMTDSLCRQGAGVVVRFNGGAQAGHTVVTPEGKRHVFHHFGSGTFAGIPTYLSEFFIINPIAYYREKDELKALGLWPVVYAHPNCLVTTFADMMINQELEDKRGKKRHGSVGLGISETIERSGVAGLKITMADLWNNSSSTERKLREICDKYAAFRTGEPIADPDKMINVFLKGCQAIAEEITPLGIADCEDPVFEGAQGLLLDQNNKEFFPHLTRSNTGMKNVCALCAQAGIDNIETYYVSRTYLTKHGAGKLPGEDPNMNFYDDTNVEHSYQGKIRFAPLDYNGLRDRCAKDFGSKDYKLVLTHVDQLPTTEQADLYSYGTTHEDIKSTLEKSIAA
jgi:adenylosuccinate synthase